MAHVSRVVNNIMLGKMNVYGTVTLAANSATTTLNDVRIGAESVVLFMPTTANAAKAIGSAQGFRGVRLRKSAGQIIATSTTTDLTWDTEDFDDDSAHSAGSSDIVVPAGVTRAEFFVGNSWGNNSTGLRTLDIHNATAGLNLASDRRSAIQLTEVSIGSGPVSVTAGDAVRVRVSQTSGASLTAGGTLFFSARWLEWGSDFYISNQGTGTLTINHANEPSTDRTFQYVVLA